MDVDELAVEGIWWRQVPHGGDPLFRADPPSDGRWQRGDVVGGLYFAQDELTAWAEWYRVLAEFAVPPERQMPRDLWRWQVHATRVADLSDATRLAAVELTLPRPTQHEWPAFQDVGQDLWRAGYSGVLAPSGSRPEFLALMLLCLSRVAICADRPVLGWWWVRVRRSGAFWMSAACDWSSGIGVVRWSLRSVRVVGKSSTPTFSAASPKRELARENGWSSLLGGRNPDPATGPGEAPRPLSTRDGHLRTIRRRTRSARNGRAPGVEPRMFATEPAVTRSAGRAVLVSRAQCGSLRQARVA